LGQISEQNIGQLGLLWDRELGTTRGLEATPLVSNGVIYTTGEWSVAYALNAKTGEILWTFDPQVPRSRARTICCDVVNRGVAIYNGQVYLGTLARKAWTSHTGLPVLASSAIRRPSPPVPVPGFCGGFQRP
jgi:quinohemoprotein ethanol dehydrogenase